MREYSELRSGARDARNSHEHGTNYRRHGFDPQKAVRGSSGRSAVATLSARRPQQMLGAAESFKRSRERANAERRRTIDSCSTASERSTAVL